MNIVEMKMYDEYLEKQRQENNYFKPKEPSHEDKRFWLKRFVDYNELVEYAFDNPVIVNILYNKFKK